MNDEEPPHFPDPEPLPLEISDVLDLHSFPAGETADLVRHWLDEVAARGWRELRIVHGRGAGVQREMVRSILRRDPRVESFGDAPANGGGWGATCVTLR